jgi:hypothetical protein
VIFAPPLKQAHPAAPEIGVTGTASRGSGPMASAPTAQPAVPVLGFDFTRIPVTPTPVQRSRATGFTGGSLPFSDAIQRSFGRHDVSQVRAHTDSGAAAEAVAMGAEAFTRGSDVTFSRPPSLQTAAHEAAHVVQQRAGAEVAGGMGLDGDAYERHADEVADRVVRGESSEPLLDVLPGALAPRRRANQGSGPAHEVTRPVTQMRRIPPNLQTLLTAASGANAANFTANAEGAERLIERAMAELTPADRAAVLTRRLMPGALTEAQFSALPRRERLSRHAEAIIALFPTFSLGDPKLIDTGPRPATADAANITKVVTHANTIFTAIASGAQDTNITQVFGAGSVAAAKLKYAEARTWMNNLHAANKIVTDRSGYSGEVSQGGLTGFQEIIRVDPSVIDSPDANDSITTLLHESMHAGNSDVSDDVYITATGFQTQSEVKKLVNAAHFEVVPWRILAPADSRAFPVVPATVPPTFQTFIPAGTTVGGVTAPARTAAEQGAVAAYERFRGAWALGLNLHLAYVQLFRTPTDWTVPQPAFGGTRFDNSLPFWSKVQKLTIHRKTIIDPASPLEAKHPVSQIDVALSEGLTRKLSSAMDLLDPLHTQAQILAFETAHSTAAERSTAFPGGAHTNADAERDFLLRLAVRDPKVAPMTGTVARDLRVVRQQGDPALSLWSDILKPRSPASFPD